MQASIFSQLETLEQEKRQLAIDLEEAFRRHKEDLEMQQMHYFQVIQSLHTAKYTQRTLHTLTTGPSVCYCYWGGRC